MCVSSVCLFVGELIDRLTVIALPAMNKPTIRTRQPDLIGIGEVEMLVADIIHDQIFAAIRQIQDPLSRGGRIEILNAISCRGPIHPGIAVNQLEVDLQLFSLIDGHLNLIETRAPEPLNIFDLFQRVLKVTGVPEESTEHNPPRRGALGTR
jgi:hypothetical protein